MLQMKNEFESYSTAPGFVEITNMAGYTANFTVSYTLNGQDFNKDSGIFSLFFSRKIDIPSDATNIHILVIAFTGVDRWITVYNNNWDNPGILKIKLYGTVFSPQAEILSDSNPPTYSLLVKNNAGFVANCSLLYRYNSKNYTVKVGDFTLGMTIKINIPKNATNLTALVIANLSSALPEFKTIYSKDYPSARNINLLISGTTISPKVTELSSSSGGSNDDPNKPSIKILKVPNKVTAHMGEMVKFNLSISNLGGSTAKTLILSEFLPTEAMFVKDSFVLNSTSIKGDSFPTSSELSLQDLKVNDSINITYSVIFNKLPAQNPIKNLPMLNFNFIDSKSKTQNASVNGDTTPLTILNNTSVPCCCCCCQKCSSSFSQYEEYIYYMKSMGYM